MNAKFDNEEIKVLSLMTPGTMYSFLPEIERAESEQAAMASRLLKNKLITAEKIGSYFYYEISEQGISMVKAANGDL